MDIIDNIIYANLNSPLEPGSPGTGLAILSDFSDPFNPALVPPLGVGTPPDFSYSVADKVRFCAYDDPSVIEKSTRRHWYDINNRFRYDSDGVKKAGAVLTGQTYVSFEFSTTYNLMYAYLVENTRILQIFERLVEKFLYDEEFGIADSNLVFNWIQNTEQLFFKTDSPRYSNIRSIIRPSSDASRRNAYWRMFGMDLAFGDINSTSNSLAYVKAKTSNQQFVPLFEKYLSEIWQGYINARNSTGPNTADINVVTDLARQVRELLIARRGNKDINSYANLNLSREEFSSVLMTSWFAFIIGQDTPIVQFLNCQSSTIGERLIKIGNKVGIQAHTKSQSLFEMAGPAATILNTIEVGGVLDNDVVMQAILSSLNPASPGTPEHVNFMNDFLTIINNYQKASGHPIKNVEANITGTVRVQQNGVKTHPAMN